MGTAVDFNMNTRRKVTQLPSKTRADGQTLRWDIPRVGLLARVYLRITGSVAGTLSAPNALGMASIISRVRLIANSGIDIYNVSGAGYHYLLRPYLDDGADPTPQATAYSAVTATTFNLDQIIPVQINQRDPVGLIMVQSEQTLVTLSVEFESDATVATGATVSATVTPIVEFFTVPADERNWPELTLAHQILEDQRTISGAGQLTYDWPRANVYLQTIHGFGIGASGSDLFSRAQLRVQQSDFIQDTETGYLDMVHAFNTNGGTRKPGVIPFDLMGTSGQGVYDLTRDTIDSRRLTDLATVITATGGGTLYTVRRQFVPMEPSRG